MSTIATDNIGTQPLEVGRARIEYPFKANGDLVTKTITRTYKQAPGYFTPTPLGSADLQLPDCYLVSESDPVPTQTNLDSFTRTYANVPSQQTVASSLVLTRPALTGTFPQVYGAFRLFQPDTTLLQYDAYTAQTVTSDSGAPVITPTGGTYTLTFNGSTTGALAYNASAGTVQTALNGLAGMAAYGSVTVAGSYTSGFTITFTDYATLSTDTTALTGYTDDTTTVNVSSASGGFSQAVTVERAQGVRTPAFSMNTSSLTIPTGTVLGANTSSSSFSVGFVAMDAATASINTAGLTNVLPSLVASFNQSAVSGGYALSVPLSVYHYDSSAGVPGGSFTLTAFGQTTAAISIAGISDEDTSAFTAAVLAACNAALTNMAARGTISVFTYTFRKTILNSKGYLFIDAIVSVSPIISGGTYTLTAFAQTTAAIAYNATAPTIQNALNLLSNVAARGNFTLTGEGFSPYGNAVLFSWSLPAAIFTGGTYTLTVFGQTTAAINVSDNIATIQAAINALSNVSARGNCVVTGAGWNSAAFITFNVAFSAPAFTGSAASVTPSPCIITLSSGATSGRVTTFIVTTQNTDRFISLTEHGFVSGDMLYFKQGGTYYPLKTDFIITSADQIKVNGAVAPYNGAAFTEIGKRTKTTYTPGIATIRANRVTDFYLPGITAGIATAADIPLPVNHGDGAAFLQAVYAGTGTINQSVGDLAPWNGPILAITKTTINAADV